MGCMASNAVLLKPNVVKISGFNFRQQIVRYHGTITGAIHSYIGASPIFEEICTDDSSSPIATPNSCFQWV